jgi:hypothetical protein
MVVCSGGVERPIIRTTTRRPQRDGPPSSTTLLRHQLAPAVLLDALASHIVHRASWLVAPSGQRPHRRPAEHLQPSTVALHAISPSTQRDSPSRLTGATLISALPLNLEKHGKHARIGPAHYRSFPFEEICLSAQDVNVPLINLAGQSPPQSPRQLHVVPCVYGDDERAEIRPRPHIS